MSDVAKSIIILLNYDSSRILLIVKAICIKLFRFHVQPCFSYFFVPGFNDSFGSLLKLSDPFVMTSISTGDCNMLR